MPRNFYVRSRITFELYQSNRQNLVTAIMKFRNKFIEAFYGKCSNTFVNISDVLYVSRYDGYRQLDTLDDWLIALLERNARN